MNAPLLASGLPTSMTRCWPLGARRRGARRRRRGPRGKSNPSSRWRPWREHCAGDPGGNTKGLRQREALLRRRQRRLRRRRARRPPRVGARKRGAAGRQVLRPRTDSAPGGMVGALRRTGSCRIGGAKREQAG